MPGPVSDSIDHVFGTSSRRDDVVRAAEEVLKRDLDGKVFRGKTALRDIVEVANGNEGTMITCELSERTWRMIRYAVWVVAGKEEF